MHKDDQMTPKERAIALSKGEPVDRMPILMFYGAPSAALVGLTPSAMFAEAKTRALLQKKTYEVFGIDGLTAKYGLHSMGIAFGAVAKYSDTSPRALIEYPIHCAADLAILDAAKLTPERDIEVRRTYETAQILLEEMGDEVGCSFGGTAPFTLASSLLGPNRLLRMLRKDPETVHKLLDFTTDAMFQICKLFLDLGCGLSFSDPVASGTILSRGDFQEFVVPYLGRLVRECKAYKPVGVTLHICGDTTAMLEDIADCGIDTFSLDNLVDISVAKEKIGHRVKLMGNVEPSKSLLLGTPEIVRQNVRECYRKGWDSPKGFLICTGCDTPMNTPMENSLAFMAEARRCAKYPINPSRFC